jgi:hypothetical protein
VDDVSELKFYCDRQNMRQIPSYIFVYMKVYIIYRMFTECRSTISEIMESGDLKSLSFIAQNPITETTFRQVKFYNDQSKRSRQIQTKYIAKVYLRNYLWRLQIKNYHNLEQTNEPLSSIYIVTYIKYINI